jgi:ATP/maltotriose-dependent transcriptional regulator MalT
MPYGFATSRRWSRKKEIASQLKISITTVAYHVQHIYEKLEVPNAPAAVNRTHRLGLFKLDK